MNRSLLSGIRVFGLAMILALSYGTVLMAAQTPAVEAAKEFQIKIQNYMAIHRMANSTVPPHSSKVSDVTLITEHQKQLAAAIRALRPKAERGDIFTRRVRTMIANTINSKLDESTRRAILATILDEGNPRSDVSTFPISLAVNATYPSSAPLSTVAPSLLAALPPLPRELEYRFVGHTLVLRDREANLIVDIMTNAI